MLYHVQICYDLFVFYHGWGRICLVIRCLVYSIVWLIYFWCIIIRNMENSYFTLCDVMYVTECISWSLMLMYAQKKVQHMQITIRDQGKNWRNKYCFEWNNGLSDNKRNNKYEIYHVNKYKQTIQMIIIPWENIPWYYTDDV